MGNKLRLVFSRTTEMQGDLQAMKGNVFAVRWEKTPRQVVLGALKSLRGTGCTMAGTVLSRVNVKRHMRYGYGDRGYYYGRYGTYYSK